MLITQTDSLKPFFLIIDFLLTTNKNMTFKIKILYQTKKILKYGCNKKYI